MSFWDFIKNWNQSREKTNSELIIGREALVTADIDNLRETGTIFLQGLEWTARSKDGSAIPKDTVIRILAIEGVKVIVEPISMP